MQPDALNALMKASVDGVKGGSAKVKARYTLSFHPKHNLLIQSLPENNHQGHILAKL